MAFPFDSVKGLKPVNSKIESVTYKGRKAIRVTDTAPQSTSDDGRFVMVTGSHFEDGVIEVDVAGDRIAGAAEVARGFVGIAFRVAQDGPPFEVFYLRPYNGRSDDRCSAITRLNTSQVQSILGIDCGKNFRGNTRLVWTWCPVSGRR